MRHLTALLCILPGLLLWGCDNSQRHTEQVLRCGYAVDELGSPAARAAYHKNALSALGGRLPVIDRYALMRQRSEQPRTSNAEAVRRASLVYEYNASTCRSLHRQPPLPLPRREGDNPPRPPVPRPLLPPFGDA
ncbi:hypothetical protein [Shimwellia blattae]|uniref:Uncharacterized protein n=1 Tax=Shimwellia blattae (strain ATCC 29907 / DSM 4481 / JCM 1650 / NBRC 105725 / CDC 9005-74) TaxID=630626 RepID=I2B8Q8_SHIBC|nr:hypothetical protein [Shimwellia blattae]AFJ46912.1 hypothetical protein EBL_c18180 [Shimwellia blattae DSM 4481 = NBRC 105725]GAB82427.1 hypothetical protein EB105725_23_00400 [Shimwellia blattae DSM 4481 = NBRC 105725]VDY64400.1 Uncharacterised protein [Shimwellia blattae]VEC22514.1 Uncharacterised protein [Shimwellia blattae]